MRFCTNTDMILLLVQMETDFFKKNNLLKKNTF